jgi:hypothetical protein
MKDVIKHDFTDLYIPSTCHLYWKKLTVPLSQSDKSGIYQLVMKPLHQYLIVVFDGAIQIEKTVQTSPVYTSLNRFDIALFTLTDSQLISLIARSAWPAQILIAEIPNGSATKASSSVIRANSTTAVGNIGLWRTLSQPVQEILGLDLIHLLIGPHNSWLGASYPVYSTFCLILFKLPVADPPRAIPDFCILKESGYQMNLIGLTGSIKVQNSVGFSDWLNGGSLLTIFDQTAVWQIENRGSTEAQFLLLIINGDGLIKNLALHRSVWDKLYNTQGAVWSRVSWPLLRGAGVNFT